MNGTADSSATTTTSVGSGAYTFFLNVVVLSTAPPQSPTEDPEKAKQPVNLAPAAVREVVEEEAAVAAAAAEAEGAGDGEGAVVAAAAGAGGALALPSRRLLDGVGMSLSKMRLGDRLTGLDKSLHDTMKAVAERSASVTSNISDKTAAYVANKTMASRASAALTKALPEVVSNMGPGAGAGAAGTDSRDADGGGHHGSGGLDVTITKVFHREAVIVLQVDLRAAALASYVAEVRGDDAAEHYRCAVSSLKLLGATESVGALEREMLPLVRSGLMGKMSEELVRTMKEKDGSGAPLEVECVALEEREEARWLFTFMEFQNQMKMK